MAIAFDSYSSSNGQTGDFSFNHTVSGLNTVLYVAVDTTISSATSVTYNGVAMTKIKGPVSPGGRVNLSHFYLVNPATGTHSIAVTNIEGYAGAIGLSLTGVDQINPVNTTKDAGNFGNSTFADVNLTTTDNTWIVSSVAVGSDGITLSPTSGSLAVSIETNTPLGATMAVGYYNAGGAGSKTIGWRTWGSNYWTIQAAAFKAAAELSSGNFLQLF